MTHGPKIRMSDVKKGRAAGKPVPPVYFGASLTNEFYGVKNIDASAAPLGSGKVANWSGDLSMEGFCIGPSTAYPIETLDEKADLNGFLIAEGNPFISDSGNATQQYNLGGVTYMSKEGCVKLYPVGDDPHAKSGMVVNSVDCHAASGMCFFSLWKFDGLPHQEAMYPDCLVYCRVDDMANPSKCVDSGIMLDETGTQICRDYRLGGGVHGMMVGKTDADDPSQVDLRTPPAASPHSIATAVPPSPYRLSVLALATATPSPAGGPAAGVHQGDGVRQRRVVDLEAQGEDRRQAGRRRQVAQAGTLGGEPVE